MMDLDLFDDIHDDDLQKVFSQLSFRDRPSFVHDNQDAGAREVIKAFRENHDLVQVVVDLECQAGKTGVMVRIVDLAPTEFGISHENCVVFTGLARNSWRKQTRDRLPPDVRVFHRQNFKKMEDVLEGKKDVFILVDEVQYGNKEESVLHATLETLAKRADCKDFATYARECNVKCVFFSATPARFLQGLIQHQPKRFWKLIQLEPGDGYYGMRQFMDAGRIKPGIEMDIPESAIYDYVQAFDDRCRELGIPVRCGTFGADFDLEDVLENVYTLTTGHDCFAEIDKFFQDQLRFSEPRYTIVRRPFTRGAKKRLDMHFDSKWGSQFDKVILDQHYNKKLKQRQNKRQKGMREGDDFDFNDAIFRHKPEKPTVVFIDELLGCADTIYKNHLGDLLERFKVGSKPNYNKTVQGLLGRACGYPGDETSEGGTLPPDTFIYVEKTLVEDYCKLRASGYEDTALLNQICSNEGYSQYSDQKPDKACSSTISGLGDSPSKSKLKEIPRQQSNNDLCFTRPYLVERDDQQLRNGEYDGFDVIDFHMCVDRAVAQKLKDHLQKNKIYTFNVPEDKENSNVCAVYNAPLSEDDKENEAKRMVYVVFYEGTLRAERTTWKPIDSKLIDQLEETFYGADDDARLQIASWNCQGSFKNEFDSSMEEFLLRHRGNTDVLMFQECKTNKTFWRLVTGNGFYPSETGEIREARKYLKLGRCPTIDEIKKAYEKERVRLDRNKSNRRKVHTKKCIEDQKQLQRFKETLLHSCKEQEQNQGTVTVFSERILNDYESIIEHVDGCHVGPGQYWKMHTIRPPLAVSLKPIHLVNVYLGHNDWSKLMKTLSHKIRGIPPGERVIAGDFNTGSDDSAWQSNMYFKGHEFKKKSDDEQAEIFEANQKRVHDFNDCMAAADLFFPMRELHGTTIDDKLTTWGGGKYDHFLLSHSLAKESTHSVDFKDDSGIRGIHTKAHRPIIIKIKGI